MNLIVAGGTFDLLHKGHKSFLTQILNQTDKLILGLTTDKYVSENKDENFENYETRRKNLEDFLIPYKEKIEIVPISDIYGPLLDPTLKPDAIAVTDETFSGLNRINSRRKELGLPGLPQVLIDMDKAEDGSEISSTRIRRGEIDREGRLYFKKEWVGKSFTLPEKLRGELSKPFGEVLTDIPDDLDAWKTVTVGDETAKIFNEKNIGHFLSIVDFKVHREKKFNSISELGFDGNTKVYKLKNLPGQINNDLFDEIKNRFDTTEKAVILIEGEDDLAVLPCLVFSPLGYDIFYGQPNQGIVHVRVTENNKEKARRLLSDFLIS